MPRPPACTAATESVYGHAHHKVMFCMNSSPVGQRAAAIVGDDAEGQEHAENEEAEAPFRETCAHDHVLC
jgi:hypothetical protein